MEISALHVVSVPFFGSLLALAMLMYLLLRVKKAPMGSGVQVDIQQQVERGAKSFLLTEYLYLGVFVIFAAIFLVLVLQIPKKPDNIADKGSWQTMICFLLGAALSAAAGYGGMMIATQTNVKTMEAAKKGLNQALQIAFAGGAVMGFTVVLLGLMGITLLFLLWQGVQKDSDINKLMTSNGYQGSEDKDFVKMQQAIRYLTGFGFGASAIALFARVAGGIYTKAADVGADLVGKVESNIPEDDPRNPATIADNVGDNVGDVAGMGADLFESFVGSIIAAAALSQNRAELAYPFWIAGFGILAACIGFFIVRSKDDASQKQLLHALHGGVYTASILIVILAAIATYILFGHFDTHESVDLKKGQEWRYFGCVLVGLVAGILIGEATEYFTAYAYVPTKSITDAGSMGGAATVIIQGLGIGMLSCVPPVLIIVITVIGCAQMAGGDYNDADDLLSDDQLEDKRGRAVYGVAIAAVGMLSTLGVTLATDAYGPVADNAGGIAEMTPDCPEEVRERTDKLDALGNTTAATGKGFAIGSAVLTSLALMAAYSKSVRLETEDTLDLQITNPLVLGGILLGAMLPFLFAALTMLSVRKAASSIIREVQYQFKNIPGLLEGKPGVTCDSNRCVQLCTQSSVKEMILPGIIAVFTPIVLGLLVGAQALGGLLIGAISSGFLMALMMSNAGGAWDNSKKYVENENVYGGKKSETHKAVVVGDTVGDPFKDTSGPALNILIKLMSVLSLVFAPLFSDDSWSTWYFGLAMLLVMIIFSAIAYFFVWVKAEAEPQASVLANKDIDSKDAKAQV